MTRRFMQFTAALLAVVLCLPAGLAGAENSTGDVMIRVGLASSSSHNDQGQMEAAHLQNASGCGSGYRFGYYDDLSFVELGRTGSDINQIAMLKTQNLYYGYDSAQSKYTYSTQITSDVLVGCYHIRIPGSYSSYDDAAAEAANWEDGFVAWINGEYQVRVGDYPNRSETEAAISSLGQGEVVATSGYGVVAVETGTDNILFQFDMGEGQAFAVLPDVTGAADPQTWFLGFKYRGGFTYQRLTSGGDLTVANVLDLESYVKGVVCYEMGREWPLEALKAQAIAARTYALVNLGTHDSLGFDLCNTDYCQVYHGTGSGRTDYGPSETSDRAVEETAGEVLWYEDTLAETYYSSSHGGASESAYYIWGTNMDKYPYLCGVEDPYEQLVADSNAYSSWTVTYTAEELQSRLRSYGFGNNTSLDYLELTYSELGNVIQVAIHWTNGQSNTITQRSSNTIRGVFNLRSIRFTVNGQTVSSGTSGSGDGSYTVNGSETISGTDGLYVISGSGTVSQAGEDLYVTSGSGSVSPLEGGSSGTNQGGGTVTVSGDTYVFEGAGWGHQIGMSQYGANAMARQGFTGEEIVEFYFPGTNVDTY